MTRQSLFAKICALVLVSFSSLSYGVQSDLSEAVKAQNQILDKQKAEREKQDGLRRLKNETQERLIALHYELFKLAKKSEIKLQSTVGDVNSINVSRRRTGVWELTATQRDNNYFVILSEWADRVSGFSPVGYGLVIARGYIRDRNFEEQGYFSQDCKYEIFIGNASRKYNCKDFVDGKIDQQVFDGMIEMFKAYLSSRAK